MLLKIKKSKTAGIVQIPGSKSHTIRAVFIASLANGTSQILKPLISNDALSAVEVCKALGATIDTTATQYNITGFNGTPRIPDDIIHVGNSGTTLRFGVMTAALQEGYSVFTGDYQIRRRPLGPLIEALNKLGARVVSTKGNGMAPVIVQGKARGGSTELDAVSSQFLSSLLINAPLLEQDTIIRLIRLNEVPYVEMTLWWLAKQGIRYENHDFKSFIIKGGQKYQSFVMNIPGDFSSATFFMVQAAISGAEFKLTNLDMTDPQGDKAVLAILQDMGAKVAFGEGAITIRGDGLTGREIDMNSIPDALPAMAVAGCFAEGETRLVNVPQARLKETDRIQVMCEELRKMGAKISELPDGLVIQKSGLLGTQVNGHGDHRVVMALAVAGLNVEGETIIDSAEAVNVTFPEFVELMNHCGADIHWLE